MANEAEKARFVHEAQAAALNHPNICTIHEIDETEGHLFIAMEFVEGQSLREKIASGMLQVASVIDFAIQIADGLQAAHEKQITHRDIKPANIMITTKGQVKIMDFGLAKLAGRTVITKEGMTLGTVAYMSPEQGRGEEVDHRTDIWSFGVVLYEMITGQHPFKGEYDQAVRYSIMNETPEPVTGLRTGVPMAFERIVNKALAKKAEERYQHVEEMAADLRRPQGPSGLQLGPKSTARPLQKITAMEALKKRLLTLILPLAMLAVAIILGVGYFFFSREAESKERIPIVVVDFVNETEEKELNGLSGMLITAMEQSRRLSVLTRSQMFDILKKSGKTAVDRIDETLGREICRHAEVKTMAMASIRKFGQVYLVDLKLLNTEKDRYLVTAKEKGSGQESIPDIIDRLAEQTRSGLKEQAAEIQATSRKIAEVTTLNLEAYQHYFLGEQLINKLKFAEAQEEFKQAIALDSTFGLAYYRWAYADEWLSHNEQLQKAQLEKALALIDRIPEKERFLVRAHSARVEKGNEAAIAVLKEMERIFPNDMEMLYNIGDYGYHAGQNTTAMEYLEKVLAMEPTHGRAVQHLAWAYRNLGNYKKMVEVAERYLSTTGSKEAYLLLGEGYARIGDFPAALNTVQKAQKLFAEDFEMSNAIGAIYLAQGDYDQAGAAYKRSLSQNNSLANFVGYTGLAQVYAVTGQCKKSIQMYDQLIELNYRANNTQWGASSQLIKGITVGEVKGDREAGWQEVQKTFKYHKEIPSSHFYWSFLARASIRFGHLDFAEQIVREKFSKVDTITYTRYMTWLLGYSGKCDEAKPFAEKLLTNKGDEDDKVQALWVLAYCDFNKEKYDRAILYLKQHQTPPHASGLHIILWYPKSFSLLGKIYEKKGETKLAIENYEKLLALWKHADPDLPDLIEAKARLAKLKGVAAK